MTAADLKHRLLRVIWQNSPGGAPAQAQDDVTHAVNQAYQFLWTMPPKEFRTHYTRRIDTVALVIGTSSYELGDDVQSVLPGVRLVSDHRLVRAATSKSEVQNYGFLRGSTTGSVDNARPEIYYCETLAENNDDATTVTLMLAPTPAAVENMAVEVEALAPVFTTEDFCDETPPKLRMPHNYAETLLYPIAAWFLASQSTYFAGGQPQSAGRMAAIQAGYEQALQAVGMTVPDSTSVKEAHHTGDT